MKCSECFHFAKIDGDDTVGFCLRNPPQVVKDYSGLTSRNPEVGINWRCGEFKQASPSLDGVAEAIGKWKNEPASNHIIRSEQVTHACPKFGDSVTPCCGIPTNELPFCDRITTKFDLVTCKGRTKEK